MKIFPTNNSISFKILKKINNYIFKCEPPSNVCTYFWLSVLYGAVGVLVLLNSIVTVEFLLTIFSSYSPWIAYCYHPLIVIWGVIFAVLIFVMLILMSIVLSLVVVVSAIVYAYDYKNISIKSFDEFTTGVQQSLDKLFDEIFYWVATTFIKIKNTKPFNKIKCPKLNFDEEE